MLGDKMVIGVCITKIQETTHSEYMSRLYALAKKQGYKLMVFNSFLDFHRQDAYDQGAKSVYELLNNNYLDAVVIIASAFENQEVVRRMAQECRTRSLPVIVVNGQAQDAWSIQGDYSDAFQQMLRHVICEHGAKDTCFFAGEADDPLSQQKLAIYRQILAENGISQERVYHCRVDDSSVREAVLAIVTSGRVPQAIFCSRDYMAFATCDVLRQKGYRVPEDVLVTGFDGVVTAGYFTPSLTTCDQNLDGLAHKTIEALSEALQGQTPAPVKKNPYFVTYAESCGCHGTAVGPDVNSTICQLYRIVSQMGFHEDEMYSWIDRVLGMENIEELYPMLSKCVLDHSYICLEEDILQPEQYLQRQNGTADHLMVIPSADQAQTAGEVQPMKRFLLLPDLLQWAEDDTLYIINAVYAGKDPCGYYAVKTSDLLYTTLKLKRVLKTLNIAVNAALNDSRQRTMRIGLETAMHTNPISGLPNIKGAQQWFATFCESAENRSRSMAISAYGIPMYSYLYEHYGIGEVEELLSYLGDALRKSYPTDSYIAHIADNELVVFQPFAATADAEKAVEEANTSFFSQITAFNEQKGKAYYLEVNNGYSIVDPGWSGSLDSFVRYAVSEMYLNRMRGSETPVMLERNAGEDYYSAFTLLLEKNLFTYHFQPIVDARSGNIYAYEALMRTSGGINLSPLDVLDIARKYGRLYEIEKITLFNIMRHYVEHYEDFGGHMLFINTIPGHFLSDEDSQRLMNLYGEYMDHVVFELTEQNTISDHELQAIRNLSLNGVPAQIAVDDYGTGHSNIVNLLRYAPQVIKIDRFLISEIQSDTNKQMFVKNTIEFARLNGIKTLAEGVETFDELQTVIEYGMDLVQGYYLGRPIAEPVPAIQDQVKNEILTKNIRLSKMDSDMRTYTANEGETINLLELAVQKYAFIDVPGGQVTLVGERDHTVDMVVRIADNANTTLVFQDVNIKGATETTVQIGNSSQMKLVLCGENTLHKEGILVPPTSTLTVEGDGGLTIYANRNEGVGIGANYSLPYGGLTFAHSGTISVKASGDKVVGIGGKTSKERIRIHNGRIDVQAQGISVVGVGSASGNADIHVKEPSSLKVHCAGDEAVSIGCVAGRVKFRSSGELEVIADSERAVGIGSLSGRDSELHFTRGKVKTVFHCYESTCIGTFDGSVNIYCTGTVIDIYGEATQICGIGSLNGRAQTMISGGTLCMDFLAANLLPCGNEQSQLTINGGNVLVNDSHINAKNLFGMPLAPVVVETDTFEKQIVTELGSYIYLARKDEDHPQLVVYLPTETEE